MGNGSRPPYRVPNQFRWRTDKSQHSRAYRRLTRGLRAARKSAGLTQAEVAARLGAYASYVSKVESGERRVDVVELAELCKVYGADLVALLRTAGLCT